VSALTLAAANINSIPEDLGHSPLPPPGAALTFAIPTCHAETGDDSVRGFHADRAPGSRILMEICASFARHGFAIVTIRDGWLRQGRGLANVAR
jgi:hypothetical protein